MHFSSWTCCYFTVNDLAIFAPAQAVVGFRRLVICWWSCRCSGKIFHTPPESLDKIYGSYQRHENSVSICQYSIHLNTIVKWPIGQFRFFRSGKLFIAVSLVQLLRNEVLNFLLVQQRVLLQHCDRSWELPSVMEVQGHCNGVGTWLIGVGRHLKGIYLWKKTAVEGWTIGRLWCWKSHFSEGCLKNRRWFWTKWWAYWPCLTVCIDLI